VLLLHCACPWGIHECSCGPGDSCDDLESSSSVIPHSAYRDHMSSTATTTGTQFIWARPTISIRLKGIVSRDFGANFLVSFDIYEDRNIGPDQVYFNFYDVFIFLFFLN
jgi:hypothetical protein